MKLCWTSLFLAASIISASSTATAAAVDERVVLLQLYQATAGHAWNENFGWVEGTGDICDWHGVICSSQELQDEGRRRAQEQPQDSQAKVLGLQLAGNFMAGRTPASLWTLPALLAVDFSENPHLDVSFAGMSGVPIVSLKLRGTATTSMTGLASASDSLEELDFSENQLDSQIPADLYSLTQLSVLKIAECGLLGSIPDNIHRLSVLREINLYKNDLTGTLPDGLSRLVHLRHLTVSFNQLHGRLPDYINDFLLLREFWALHNDFTGPVPSLHQAPDIRKVYLNSNSLTGNLPTNFMEATLGGRQNVDIDIHVNLASNALTGVIPEALDNLEDLNIEWMLGDNEWTGVHEAMCDNVNWNNGAIEEFGCFGFLCPPESFSRHGFQTEDTACQPCQSAEFFGATSCFDKDDRSVLVELYVELQGESWERQDNWLQEDDFCTWYGVECWDVGDAKTGRVRKILLPNNGLAGNVPDTIYSMHHLTTIDFARNNIVLPFTNIGESLHMYSINVAQTKTKDFDGIEEASELFHELFADQIPIQGTFPQELLTIPDLHILSLQECGMSGELPSGLFGLVQLRELYLSNNEFDGNIPDRWNELQELQILALAKNRFRGSLPPTLDQVPNLIAVSLQDQVTKGGGLSGGVEAFATTTSIRTLLLADNRLEGDLPENLLTGMESDLPITVDLSNNLVTGKVHGTYDRFKRMNLYLEGNFITEVEDQLCNQDDWMSGSVGEYGCDAILCPSGTIGGRQQYTGSSCQPCAADGADKVVYFGQTQCGKDVTGNLSERDILELLYDSCGGVNWRVHDNWITQESICEWYGIACNEDGSVTSIELGANQLVGSFPTEIFILPNLKHLKMYSNSALYFNLEGIENAKNLRSLGLDDTGLSSLKGIGRARSLLALNVASNNLSGAMPEEMSRLVNLRTLDISRNNFSGYLPYWLRGLVSLTTLLASHNNFAGPVFDFATLKDVVYLDLSHNKLSGAVPTELLSSAGSDEKIVVDLSSNSLGGTIPIEMSRLSKLSLQVENNRITGVDGGLCAVGGWNDNDVEQFGCDAILCPAGTWNQLGRQSNDDTPCTTCGKATYMGTTVCSSGTVPGALVALTIALIFSMLL